MPEVEGPLHGVRVVDAATLAAGPLVATAMGEFGADVIKVEQPGAGDPLRTWGDRKDEIGLVWKSMGRNKRCVTLDLRHADGQDLFHRLLDVSDVLVINNRPTALTRWGIDYESVHERHPQLVMLHVSGYGRGGPKSDSPGFGTLAEAMSGFAHLTGQPDGPPTLPPFMLADGVAALAATYAVMMALYHRDVHGGGGQLVDVNLIEPLARLIESSTLAFDQLGRITGRVGNRFDASAPRNTYRTSDGKWVAISSASPNIAARVYRAIDRPDLAENPDYIDPVSRQQRALEVDELVAEWIGRHTLDEAMAVFEAGLGGRRTGVRRRAAAGRRASAGQGDLRPGRRSRPRPDDRPRTGRRADRDAGTDRPSRPSPGCRQRRGLRRPPRHRARPPGRPPGGRRHLTATSLEAAVTQPRARRSELATPASSEKMCEKAAGSGADLVFLDLEDACAPVAKEAARGTAVAALTGCDWGRTVRAVRVNGLETPWCHGDIIEVVTGARESLDVLIVPKARSARDVWWVDVLLTQLETKLGLAKRIGLEVLIEEAEGLSNAAAIAGASDRLEAIIFGAGDLSASLRARVDGNFDPISEYPGDFWHFARVQVLAAARAQASMPSMPRTRRTRTLRASGVPRCTPACWDSTGSGPSIPIRSPSPTRCSPPRPRRSKRLVRPSPPTGAPRPKGWAPSGGTGSSSMPHTCAWPKMSSTKRRLAPETARCRERCRCRR